MDNTNACGICVLKCDKAFKTRVGYRRQVVNIKKGSQTSKTLLNSHPERAARKHQ